MQNQRLRILLIEDDPDDVLLIRDSLSGRFAAGCEVQHFERLTPALDPAAMQAADVALLDLSLPDSQGLATFEALQRARPALPIIVLSGFDDEKFALDAVQAGAQDYLIKAHVDDHLLARSIHYAIERRRRADAERALRASEAKLRVAREVQQRLFPTCSPVTPGYDIAGASFPADATGGDYFDFIPMVGGGLGVVIGDVSGHGVGPAFLMVETRACLRSLALRHDDPALILHGANQILSQDTDDFHFVTLLLARLDAASSSLIYASAGHACYLFGPDGEVRALDSISLPLGVDAGASFPCSPVLPLASGQLVLLLTDGIFETVSPDGDQFGLERVFAEVRRNRHRAAREIVDCLHEAAREFSRGRPQQDDITAVVVKVLSANQGKCKMQSAKGSM